MNNSISFPQKVFIAVGITLVMLGLTILFVYTINFFFLVFAGILLGVCFRAMASWLSSKVPVPKWLSLIFSVLFAIGLLFAAVVLLAPTVDRQIEQIRETLPQSLAKLQRQMADHPWGQRMFDEVNDNYHRILPDQEQAITEAVGIVSTTLGVLADLFIIVVIGLFFAAQPRLYKNGIVALFPVRYRTRISEVIYKTYRILYLWLFGKFLAMFAVGIMTGVGLVILGVPLPIGLAVIAFVLDFIPTIGPIIAAIPAILIAFLAEPQLALWTALLYFVVQSIESYILVPIIYQRTVSVSPVLTLASLVFFGILVGPIGVILAAPLVAMLQVVINELYVKSYLEGAQAENNLEVPAQS
jgi:predicted PurR-regulated permease PerM